MMTQQRKDSTLSLIVDTYSAVRPSETISQVNEHFSFDEENPSDSDLSKKQLLSEQSLFGKAARKFSALKWWKKGLIGLSIVLVFLS